MYKGEETPPFYIGKPYIITTILYKRINMDTEHIGIKLFGADGNLAYQMTMNAIQFERVTLFSWSVRDAIRTRSFAYRNTLNVTTTETEVHFNDLDLFRVYLVDRDLLSRRSMENYPSVFITRQAPQGYRVPIEIAHLFITEEGSIRFEMFLNSVVIGLDGNYGQNIVGPYTSLLFPLGIMTRLEISDLIDSPNVDKGMPEDAHLESAYEDRVSGGFEVD